MMHALLLKNAIVDFGPNVLPVQDGMGILNYVKVVLENPPHLFATICPAVVV